MVRDLKRVNKYVNNKYSRNKSDKPSVLWDHPIFYLNYPVSM